MTKASVIKSQTGQGETLLKMGRQKKEIKKGGDGERQTREGVGMKAVGGYLALRNTIKVSSLFIKAINCVLM